MISKASTAPACGALFIDGLLFNMVKNIQEFGQDYKDALQTRPQ